MELKDTHFGTKKNEIHVYKVFKNPRTCACRNSKNLPSETTVIAFLMKL